MGKGVGIYFDVESPAGDRVLDCALSLGDGRCGDGEGAGENGKKGCGELHGENEII